MKRKLQKQRGILLALLSFLCVISIKAQTWTAPTLTGSTLTTSTQYYVYNVGANGFLARGGQWSGQAVVAPSGYKVTANSSASLWQLYFEDNTKTLWPADVNDGWTYTDNTANNAWDIQLFDAGNSIYTIQIANTYASYNASQYLGASATVYAANNGICNDVRYNRAGGDSYTQWKFVSQVNLDLYNAKVLLDRYLNLGKNKGMDISSYITTYNAGVTADINRAAANLLTALNRTDVTSSILNPSFEDSFTSWTNTGGFAIQTNDPGQGWTKAGSNYVEKYTGSGWNGGNSLTAGSITQTVSGLSNGLYELVVSGHAVQQAGGNPLHTGAFITAGSQSTEVGAGGDYTVSNINVTDGTLAVGYSLVGQIACNWTGFDNFRLYYYGQLAVPLIIASKTQFAFDGNDGNVSDSLTVTGSNLSGAISISAPAGITVTPTSLASDASSAKVIVTYDGTTTVSGNITFTSGTTTANVAVTGAPNTGCFTPLYPNGNLIADPYCNSLDSYAGWGGRAVVTDYVYCGSRSIKVTGQCGGSLDYNLTGKIAGSKTYRVKAMVSTNGTGEAKIGISGATAATITHTISTAAGEWLPVDFTFNTDATVSSPNMFLNSCETQTATESYIDNYEMYDITSFVTGVSQVAERGFNAYISDKKIVTKFDVESTSSVEISLYNINGMLLETNKATYAAGTNVKTLNSMLPAGVYIVKMSVNGKLYIKKVIK
jgi:hypothetical protein